MPHAPALLVPVGRTLCGAAAALAVAVVLALAPGQAQAGIVCTETQTNSYSPGITYTPQSVTVRFSDILAPCVASSVPGIRSGTMSNTVTVTRSCLDLLGSGSVTRTITWNTGQTTTFTGNYLIQIVAGQLVAVYQGAVTSGVFRGSAQLARLAMLGDLTDCSAPGGLRGLGGVGTFTLL